MTDDDRKRRIGLNEAMFREVNERVRGINETFGVLTGEVHIVCECADATCTERIELTLDEYESVRAVPEHFAVAPGHVAAADVEHVIAENERWELVRKLPGPPANIARVTDPRDST